MNQEMSRQGIYVSDPKTHYDRELLNFSALWINSRNGPGCSILMSCCRFTHALRAAVESGCSERVNAPVNAGMYSIQPLRFRGLHVVVGISFVRQIIMSVPHAEEPFPPCSFFTRDCLTRPISGRWSEDPGLGPQDVGKKCVGSWLVTSQKHCSLQKYRALKRFQDSWKT